MALAYVLVHSPLVGPATWSGVAGALGRSGRTAYTPSLLGIAGAEPPRWRWAVEAVASAIPATRDELVLVGHSGSGLLLPAIGAALGGRVAAYVFAEAALPPRSGETPVVPEWLLDQVRALATDGRVKPWSEWWEEGAMQQLVPDEEVRRAIERELPSLPLAYFEEERIPVPGGWDRVPVSYLYFSEAYEADAAEAATRGYATDKIDGGHLHAAVEPEHVGARIVELAEAGRAP